MTLPGPSAIGLAFAGMWCSVSLLALLATLAAGLIVRGSGYAGFVPLTTVMLLVLVNVAVAITMAFWHVRKERKEVQSGYVTSMRGHQDLDQVHPGSGWVIRAAGEDYISRAEYVSRVQVISDVIGQESRNH